VSKIEWTDKTWNPIRARDKETGKDGWFCVHASEGCRNCWAEDLNLNRRNLAFGNGHAYAAQNRDKVDIHIHEKTLLAPLGWRAPRKVFVCSMTDLFLDEHYDAWIDLMFVIMAWRVDHTFQILTKRPERMQDYFRSRQGGDPWAEAADYLADLVGLKDHPYVPEPHDFPLPNVWLGVSVEDQKTADARVPVLLATPAAVRFVSYEPALGPVNIWPRIAGQRGCGGTHRHGGASPHDHGAGSSVFPGDPTKPHHHHDDRCPPGIDQVIFGGESGPDRRPAQMDWGRAVRDQCRAAGAAFFGKQNDKVASLPDDLDIREWPR